MPKRRSVRQARERKQIVKLSKGGAQGVHSALQFAADAVGKSISDNHTDEGRGAIVDAVMHSLNKTVQDRITDDQPSGRPPHGPNDGELPPPAPEG